MVSSALKSSLKLHHRRNLKEKKGKHSHKDKICSDIFGEVLGENSPTHTLTDTHSEDKDSKRDGGHFIADLTFEPVSVGTD